MFQLAVLSFVFAPLILVIALGTSVTPMPTETVLVCSGSVPVGNIVSANGAYYAISETTEDATGMCSCDRSTGRLDCGVPPTFPISTPQGPAVCQSQGTETCASSNIFLCQTGKLIGGLNSEGGFFVTDRPDMASGYCQCDMQGEAWRLRCPDYPLSSSFAQFSQNHIDCSKQADCSGL
ncbi:hypothetical protein PTTG_09826 [Puccinia triticina 1-1 BBBD Race 1]|uniref:Uncharacterized protein n=2 Tax=Puccinia triticina TaxID=208348 RepID=A0A180G5G8_PUCT1|nr:uncharacterized protein PtA15_3A216 [Puccinia triticina]OAV87103.1 hypothetical protein PTTG_09826 [Puccinia triticina 1-1 BBBD Race 1]WAQ82851.1 hypothetical protein PtA15_3A216 [Puccinia triticina]